MRFSLSLGFDLSRALTSAWLRPLDIIAHGFLQTLPPVGFGVLGLVHLLERKPQPPPLRVNADDPQRQHLPFFDGLAGVVDAAIGQFRNVNQPFDLIVVLDPRERAELGQLGDGAFDELPHLVASLNPAPRVLFQALERQPDALAVVVHIEDFDLDLLADLEDLHAGA